MLEHADRWIGVVSGGIALVTTAAAVAQGWTAMASAGLGTTLVGGVGLLVAWVRRRRGGHRGRALLSGAGAALVMGIAVMVIPWSGAAPDVPRGADRPDEPVGATSTSSATGSTNDSQDHVGGESPGDGQIGGTGAGRSTGGGDGSSTTSSPSGPPPTTPTTPTTTPPPPVMTGTVQGCNTYGENCDGNPIYRNLPPEPYNYQTWSQLAAVANGTRLSASCWATGGTTTNFAVGDPGPNPYSSNVHYYVEAPGGAWGWIPDTYFVRDQSGMGLPLCAAR